MSNAHLPTDLVHVKRVAMVKSLLAISRAKKNEVRDQISHLITTPPYSGYARIGDNITDFSTFRGLDWDAIEITMPHTRMCALMIEQQWFSPQLPFVLKVEHRQASAPGADGETITRDVAVVSDYFSTAPLLATANAHAYGASELAYLCVQYYLTALICVNRAALARLRREVGDNTCLARDDVDTKKVDAQNRVSNSLRELTMSLTAFTHGFAVYWHDNNKRDDDSRLPFDAIQHLAILTSLFGDEDADSNEDWRDSCLNLCMSLHRHGITMPFWLDGIHRGLNSRDDTQSIINHLREWHIQPLAPAA